MKDFERKYANYILEHKANVKKAFEWLITNVRDKINFGDFEKTSRLIDEHDLSKWSTEEFGPYAHYYNVAPDNLEEYNKAWNHHQKTNPHHWQYWVLIEDDNGKPTGLKMDQEYVIEMICDWWSFGFKTGKLNSIFDWYKKNKSKQILHPDTRKEVEDILKVLKENVK